MTGIRSFMKAYAILWQKLYAGFSEHTFNQGGRVLVSRVATDLDIRNRVSMKTGRLSQVPNRPIQRSARHPNLCACHRHETVPMSHVTTSHLISPRRGINGDPVNFKPSEPITAGRSRERKPPAIPRRLGRADHHEPRRAGADPALEGKARENRAWAGRNGRSALGSAPCPSV